MYISSLLSFEIFLIDKFIASVMGKDVVQKGKYIAMFTTKYSQTHTKKQVRITCLCALVCMYVCMNVCIYVCIYVIVKSHYEEVIIVIARL